MIDQEDLILIGLCGANASVDDWSRASEGNANFANTIANELSDIFDYMRQGGASEAQASDMLLELVERVNQTKATYGQAERVPRTADDLLRRQQH